MQWHGVVGQLRTRIGARKTPGADGPAQRPIQFGIRLLPRRAVAQPHDGDKVRSLPLALSAWLESRVDIGIQWRGRALGQDADNRVRLALQQNGLSHDVRVSAKRGLPQRVTQDGCPGTLRTILFVGKNTPYERMKGQHVEILG